MIISNIFQIVSVLALIALAAADGPTCETSPASPWVLDCLQAAENISKDIGDRIGNEDCVLPNTIKSKCETVKTHHSCKVDLCFVGGTSEGAVQKNRIVDAAKKLIYDGGCGQFAIDGDKQGLKIGGFYTIDNPREEFKTDKWCHAPKKSMKVQFSKS
ncbi:hypothetical protein F4820DRAFT_443241 [Hypoxylon rubiginosum]|uniref:Uncharacterized protein n=1 Tax=Hypoxylon rubiginosum TaxID=110542 RepID=A0ACB9ZG15_9PEZI|nr:hypothetical protein F4820DRAFT_443241 [Hypoxylon rubiginosum]